MLPGETWRQQARAAASGDRRAWFIAETGPPWVALGLVNGRRRPPTDVLLFSMWVDPAGRRRGIGRRLIEALDAWASRWGAQRTVLWVFAGNEPAIRFYLRLGFMIEMNGPDAETGKSYGALAMVRPTLTGGGSTLPG